MNKSYYLRKNKSIQDQVNYNKKFEYEKEISSSPNNDCRKLNYNYKNF